MTGFGFYFLRKVVRRLPTGRPPIAFEGIAPTAVASVWWLCVTEDFFREREFITRLHVLIV